MQSQVSRFASLNLASGLSIIAILVLAATAANVLASVDCTWLYEFDERCLFVADYPPYCDIDCVQPSGNDPECGGDRYFFNLAYGWQPLENSAVSHGQPTGKRDSGTTFHYYCKTKYNCAKRTSNPAGCDGNECVLGIGSCADCMHGTFGSETWYSSAILTSEDCES
jgi:hypothetical protein